MGRILTALHKDSLLHPLSKLWLRSLAATDLCVDLIAELVTVTYWMSLVNEHCNTCPHLIVARFIIALTLCPVSVGILTAISMDRLIALFLGLRLLNYEFVD